MLSLHIVCFAFCYLYAMLSVCLRGCRELEDLERSHTYLIDLVERMSIPVFTEIKSALDCTKIVLDNVRDHFTLNRSFIF